MKLTTHLHLVPRLTMCGAIPPLLFVCLWHAWYLVKHRDNFTFTWTKVRSKLSDPKSSAATYRIK